MTALLVSGRLNGSASVDGSMADRGDAGAARPRAQTPYGFIAIETHESNPRRAARGIVDSSPDAKSKYRFKTILLAPNPVTLASATVSHACLSDGASALAVSMTREFPLHFAAQIAASASLVAGRCFGVRVIASWFLPFTPISSVAPVGGDVFSRFVASESAGGLVEAGFVPALTAFRAIQASHICRPRRYPILFSW